MTFNVHCGVVTLDVVEGCGIVRCGMWWCDTLYDVNVVGLLSGLRCSVIQHEV